MQRTYAQGWNDYELIDAGNNKKLERWGNIITIRPDRMAYFDPVFSEKDWRKKAHFEFIESTKSSGTWNSLKPGVKSEWQVSYEGVKINLELTRFKHIGLFPEQVSNWEYISEHIQNGDRFLNLFAYTGASSLVAKDKGADVFHCDSVKQVINWAKANMDSSGLKDIHWVLEDALKFAQREVKRGNKYKGIIMDPPAFGIGAKKERWKIEDKFPELIQTALKLREKGGFIIVNTYSPRLDNSKIIEITSQLKSFEKVEVTGLSMKTKTGKRLDFGQRTLITD